MKLTCPATLTFYLRPAPAVAVWLAAADCSFILYLHHQELKSWFSCLHPTHWSMSWYQKTCWDVSFKLRYSLSRSIGFYRLRQQKWPIIFTGFWSIYTDLWTPTHILFDCPWSHDSKMGWTISVGQDRSELDQLADSAPPVEYNHTVTNLI